MMNRTALVDLEVHPDGRRSRNHLVEEGSRDAAVQLEHQIDREKTGPVALTLL